MMDDVVPELDANHVRQWAHDKTPEEFRDEMRVEVDETPRGLTILECRPPWSELIGSEWTRAPIARLTYSKQSGAWTLYYAGPQRSVPPVPGVWAELPCDGVARGDRHRPDLHLLGLTALSTACAVCLRW